MGGSTDASHTAVGAQHCDEPVLEALVRLTTPAVPGIGGDLAIESGLFAKRGPGNSQAMLPSSSAADDVGSDSSVAPLHAQAQALIIRVDDMLSKACKAAAAADTVEADEEVRDAVTPCP